MSVSRFGSIAILFLLASMTSFASTDTSNQELRLEEEAKTARMTLDNFKKRFILVRKEGKLVEVKDNLLASGFQIRPLLSYFKNLIAGEQALMSSLEQTSYQKMVDGVFLETYQTTPDYLQESLFSLQQIDLDKVFNHPQFLELTQKFEARVNEELAKIGIITLAKPQDPKFFYTRQVIYEITKMFMNMAKSQLGEIPVLNTALFVMSEAEKMIRTRRTFHQNMLLHYLENFKEEELGLTHDEANMIWSSIYESRIAWYAFFESDAAVANWNKYGTDRFFQYIRMANNRLRDQRASYESLGVRHNFAFQDATMKGKKVIINLFDTKDMFSSRQAVAYYYESPNLVMRQRVLLQLGQLGLSFVSIPGFIKDLAASYMKSMYESQRLTEGALVGYFESQGKMIEARQWIRQNVNPFQSGTLE